ncbi:MAG: hypothetical protein IPK60_17040 [Sandaracinaceae bacterium]|nr:hypothetical protein [Sandaracinaceae bacterium]
MPDLSVEREKLRFTDSPPSAAEVGKLIADGKQVVVQYSSTPLANIDFAALDLLSKKHGPLFEVRFYGMKTFDCSVLKRLPNVAALCINMVETIEGISHLIDLKHLQELELGVANVPDPSLLTAGSFEQLRHLALGESKKGFFDLAPLARMKKLTHVSLMKQSHNVVHGLKSHPNVEYLHLHYIPQDISLAFVATMPHLKKLRVLLGGRANLDECAHKKLQHLQVTRVRGLSKLDLNVFPSLETLRLEDQLQLKSLSCATNTRLKKIYIYNCKTLARIDGLTKLRALEDLFISRTAVNLEQLIDSPLPKTLRRFRAVSGKAKDDKRIKTLLATRGYA